MQYIFIPSALEGEEYLRFAGRKYPTRVIGRIIHINLPHRHFTVRGVHPETGALITETIKF